MFTQITFHIKNTKIFNRLIYVYKSELICSVHIDFEYIFLIIDIDMQLAITFRLLGNLYQIFVFEYELCICSSTIKIITEYKIFYKFEFFLFYSIYNVLTYFILRPCHFLDL